MNNGAAIIRYNGDARIPAASTGWLAGAGVQFAGILTASAPQNRIERASERRWFPVEATR